MQPFFFLGRGEPKLPRDSSDNGRRDNWPEQRRMRPGMDRMSVVRAKDSIGGTVPVWASITQTDLVPVEVGHFSFTVPPLALLDLRTAGRAQGVIGSVLAGWYKVAVYSCFFHKFVTLVGLDDELFHCPDDESDGGLCSLHRPKDPALDRSRLLRIPAPPEKALEALSLFG